MQREQDNSLATEAQAVMANVDVGRRDTATVTVDSASSSKEVGTVVDDVVALLEGTLTLVMASVATSAATQVNGTMAVEEPASKHVQDHTLAEHVLLGRSLVAEEAATWSILVCAAETEVQTVQDSLQAEMEELEGLQWATVGAATDVKVTSNATNVKVTSAGEPEDPAIRESLQDVSMEYLVHWLDAVKLQDSPPPTTLMEGSAKETEKTGVLAGGEEVDASSVLHCEVDSPGVQRKVEGDSGADSDADMARGMLVGGVETLSETRGQEFLQEFPGGTHTRIGSSEEPLIKSLPGEPLVKGTHIELKSRVKEPDKTDSSGLTTSRALAETDTMSLSSQQKNAPVGSVKCPLVDGTPVVLQRKVKEPDKGGSSGSTSPQPVGESSDWMSPSSSQFAATGSSTQSLLIDGTQIALERKVKEPDKADAPGSTWVSSSAGTDLDVQEGDPLINGSLIQWEKEVKEPDKGSNPRMLSAEADSVVQEDGPLIDGSLLEWEEETREPDKKTGYRTRSGRRVKQTSRFQVEHM